MGYEIWDRDAGVLLAHFPTEEPALAYLRRLVKGFDAQETTKTIARMQLVCVSGQGAASRVVAEGAALLQRVDIAATARYDIWDRFERAYIGDFDSLEQALAFLERMVEGQSSEKAAATLDPFQLIEVGEDGTTTPKFGGGRELGQLRAQQQELRRGSVL